MIFGHFTVGLCHMVLFILCILKVNCNWPHLSMFQQNQRLQHLAGVEHANLKWLWYKIQQSFLKTLLASSWELAQQRKPSTSFTIVCRGSLLFSHPLTELFRQPTLLSGIVYSCYFRKYQSKGFSKLSMALQ